jgi:AcrR family transcriptional regulator
MNRSLRDDRKQRLVSCAKSTFASKGYYATSISEIVQHAGIARGTFYQYFDNKLHIFQSILDSFLSDLQDCVRPVSLSPGAQPPLVQIQDNLARVFELVLRERDLAQILLHHAGPMDRSMETRLEEFYDQLAEMIQRSMALGMTMGLVRQFNARLTSYAIIGAVKEVVFQITSSRGPQPPVGELVQELLEFGMGGILSESRHSLMEAARRGGSQIPRQSPAGR